MKVAWLDRALRPCPYFGLCQSERAYLKELRRLGIKDAAPWITPGANATTQFMERPDGNEIAIVCIEHDPKRRPVEIVGLLVHEGTHIWQRVREMMREHSPSSEFEAYTVQSIAQELIDAYRPRLFRR